jgi:deoxyadenosine/deoxycytidine kinase
LVVFGQEFYSRAFLTDDDWALLCRLNQTVEGLLPPAGLLVHIDIDPAEALTRLRERARSSESGVDLEYLAALCRRYDELLSQWDLSPVLRLDADSWDFRRDHDTKVIAARIDAALQTNPGTRRARS